MNITESKPVKRRLVRLHVNRAEIRKGNKGWPWTIHMSDQCIKAKRVFITVPCSTEYQPERRQNPKVFVTTRAHVRSLGHGHFELS